LPEEEKILTLIYEELKRVRAALGGAEPGQPPGPPRIQIVEHVADRFSYILEIDLTVEHADTPARLNNLGFEFDALLVERVDSDFTFKLNSQGGGSHHAYQGLAISGVKITELYYSNSASAVPKATGKIALFGRTSVATQD